MVNTLFAARRRHQFPGAKITNLYGEALARGDARTKRLIAAVLEDFERLSGAGAKEE